MFIEKAEGLLNFKFDNRIGGKDVCSFDGTKKTGFGGKSSATTTDNVFGAGEPVHDWFSDDIDDDVPLREAHRTQEKGECKKALHHSKGKGQASPKQPQFRRHAGIFKRKAPGESPLSFQGHKHLYMDGCLKGDRFFSQQMGRLHVDLNAGRVSYEEHQAGRPPKVTYLDLPKDQPVMIFPIFEDALKPQWDKVLKIRESFAIRFHSTNSRVRGSNTSCRNPPIAIQGDKRFDTILAGVRQYMTHNMK